jgi:hypothetical protein
MSRERLLAKPVWAHFQHLDLDGLPHEALRAADAFFHWIRETGTPAPDAADLLLFADLDPDPATRLAALEQAFALLVPEMSATVASARRRLAEGAVGSGAGETRTSRPGDGEASRRRVTGPVPKPDPPAGWDPCARPHGRVRRRAVSVYPWELPEPWRAALCAAGHGRPGVAAAAPARSILARQVQKLCQLAFSAGQADLPVSLAPATIDRFMQDLQSRLAARPGGLRWATLRATAEELHRFARYTGAPEDVVGPLRAALSKFEGRERLQDPKKFAALLETGNTTQSVLDTADALLAEAAHAPDLKSRHRLRTAACVLGLFSIAPLRNTSADLVFGETLFWREGAWVIDTAIQKTDAVNPERFTCRLIPEFGTYIDMLLLGDDAPRHLPAMRERALAQKKCLIRHHDGSRPGHKYIPTLFKEFTGTSFTTTRTMLHTDQARRRGLQGTRDTMALAHQRTERIAAKYDAGAVREVATETVKQDVSARRAEAAGRSTVLAALDATMRRLGSNASKDPAT